ncbi:MAG: MOSC domain-containing protein [Candidatus Acidoferrales bacterium]|nr:MOSC domain-containing protein [Acidobacteriia bacterium AH_259_A11_L15]
MAEPGRVVALWVSPRRGQPMELRSAVRARENYGLEGCAHARPNGARQVLLIDSETLEEFGVPPGALKENLTTQGLEVPSLPPGTRLQVGGVLLEVAKECRPCREVNHVQPGLLERIAGRRGQLARVLAGGEIQVGDPIITLSF